MPVRLRFRLRAKTAPHCKVARQMRRRRAVSCLNRLAEELMLSVPPLRVKERSAALVTRRIRMLEPQCQAGGLPHKLREAVELWSGSGGKLLRDIVPPQEDSTTQDPQDDSAGIPAPLPLHKVLDSNFRLKSLAFMVTYNSSGFSKETWPAFHKHVRKLARSISARAWAANWEQSLEAQGGARFHGHGYFFWTDGLGYNRRNTDELVFEDVRPRIDVCTAKGPKFRESACRGLWYVSIFKKGTCTNATNYPPWRQYTPKGGWLEDLWGAHKLTHDQYLNLSAQYGRGHSSRRRDALDALRDERESKVRKLVESELEMMVQQKRIKEAKKFENVEEFAKLFSGAPRFRRPILAIIGGTNLGKSMLAADVLRKVAREVGMDGIQGDVDFPFLEVTVEDSMSVDLGDLDVCVHAGVLFDGVVDAFFLKNNREVLQGTPKVCKGGKSGTMIYAYPFTLCRRAVVATFDLSAANLNLFHTDHWLSDQRNVIQLHLNSPAWGGASALPVQAVIQPRALMASWTVGQLAEFLVNEDMCGPAEALRTAGVNGADFLVWGTPAELQADMRLAPFTARKLIASRVVFLAR